MYYKLVNVDDLQRVCASLPARSEGDATSFYATLKLSGVHIDDFLSTLSRGTKYTCETFERKLFRYMVKTKQYDFGLPWYTSLVNIINESSVRYSGKKIISSVRKDLNVYRLLFKTYCQTVKYNIYNPVNDTALRYYVLAQFSARADMQVGLLIAPKLKFFVFKNAFNTYLSYLSNNCPAAKVQNRPQFIFHDSNKRNYGYRFDQLANKDASSTRYVSVALPILNCKLPNIKNFNETNLVKYLTTLEFLIIREQALQRNMNRVLLSIEHLRGYVYARQKYPYRFSY